MHAARIGASQGIGRATAPLLLEDPNRSVSLLLRIPCTIESDPDFQRHIEQGRVTIVEGDAENQEDLRRFLSQRGLTL